jgi:hypothetical protein
MVLSEGVLIEAKEWWQSIEYACDNEMIEYAFKKVQLFFLLGVGSEDRISLLLRSQGFQWVSMMFFKFPMWSSRVFPITFHFISYPLPKVLFFHQKGEARGNIPSSLASISSFRFFLMMGQSKWPIAKKKNLRNNPSNE